MTIVNATPHPVSLMTIAGDIVTIEPSAVIRLAELTVDDGTVASDAGAVPLVRISYADAGLPPRDPDRTLIVSALVAFQHADRDDLVFPAGLVRDGDGSLSYARALARPFGAP